MSHDTHFKESKRMVVKHVGGQMLNKLVFQKGYGNVNNYHMYSNSNSH